MRSIRTASVAAFAASAVALAFPAMASAAEREWDIGAYDQCLTDGNGKGQTYDEMTKHRAKCCVSSGGVWNAAENKCQSPPKEERANITQQDDLPTYTLEPSAPRVTRTPSGVITTTLE